LRRCLKTQAVGSSAAENGDSDIVSSRAEAEKPALLVLDAAYTLEMIRERGLENSILCRDLDGFFRHVWSVHPFATMLTSERWTPRFGSPVSHELGARHTFIEGKIGRFPALKSVFPVNFLLAQAGLFFELLRLIRSEDIRVIRVGDPLYLGLFGLMLARPSRSASSSASTATTRKSAKRRDPRSIRACFVHDGSRNASSASSCRGPTSSPPPTRTMWITPFRSGPGPTE
jgi:hypothetical protein